MLSLLLSIKYVYYIIVYENVRFIIIILLLLLSLLLLLFVFVVVVVVVVVVALITRTNYTSIIVRRVTGGSCARGIRVYFSLVSKTVNSNGSACMYDIFGRLRSFARNF